MNEGTFPAASTAEHWRNFPSPGLLTTPTHARKVEEIRSNRDEKGNSMATIKDSGFLAATQEVSFYQKPQPHSRSETQIKKFLTDLAEAVEI